MVLLPFLVARVQLFVTPVRRLERGVRNLLQVAFDLPDVAPRKPPVVAAQLGEVAHAVAGNAPRQIDVRREITPRQVAQGTEDGPSSVQARVARARDRAPAPALLKDKEDVIEFVL